MWERLYRTVLRLYPRDFRDQCGEELISAFRAVRAESHDGVASKTRRATREVIDLIRNLPGEWRETGVSPSRGQGTAGGGMDGILRDTRYAWRGVTRRPGFASVVVLTLGLGIGAITGVLGVIDTVLLRPFDWPDDDELVYLWESYQEDQSKSLSYLNWIDWRDQNRVFEGLGAYSVWSLTLTGAGPAAELSVDLASSELFEVLGVQPARGRVFTPADEALEAKVVLLSEGFWKERFGSDPEIIGSTLVLSGESWEVVGVLPERMDPPLDGADIYAPITTLSPGDRANRGSHPGIQAFGRLRSGMDINTARTDLARVTSALAEAYPESNREAGANLVSYRDRYLGPARPVLRTLGIASLLFLLLICANVGSLLVARASDRQQEVAVRSALGASRGRLVRLALIEVGMLSAGRALIGFGVAAVGLDLAAAFQPGELPRLDRLTVDLRLFAAALAAGAFTAAVAGIVPAIRLSLIAPRASLTTGQSSGGPGKHLARRGLVVVEVAMATALLVGAGLMARSVANLTAQDLGLDTRNVLVARVPLSQASYPTATERAGLYRQLLDRVELLPGVSGAAGIDPVPLGTNNRQFSLSGVGHPTIDDAEGLRVDTYVATTGYFNTVGIPLLAGRSFDGREAADAPAVVIDDRLAARVWPGESPAALVGRTLRFRGDDSPPLTVIGVAGHVRHYGFREEGRGQIYLPSVATGRTLSIVVRRGSSGVGGESAQQSRGDRPEPPPDADQHSFRAGRAPDRGRAIPGGWAHSARDRGGGSGPPRALRGPDLQHHLPNAGDRDSNGTRGRETDRDSGRGSRSAPSRRTRSRVGPYSVGRPRSGTGDPPFRGPASGSGHLRTCHGLFPGSGCAVQSASGAPHHRHRSCSGAQVAGLSGSIQPRPEG